MARGGAEQARSPPWPGDQHPAPQRSDGAGGRLAWLIWAEMVEGEPVATDRVSARACLSPAQGHGTKHTMTIFYFTVEQLFQVHIDDTPEPFNIQITRPVRAVASLPSPVRHSCGQF